MKKTLALVTALALSSPVMAWGDREQGALIGIVGTLLFQNVQKNQVHTDPPQTVYVQPQTVYVQPPPVVVLPQVTRHRQVILQNTGVFCTPGLAAFYNERVDAHGRLYYVFDSCK